MVTLWLLSTDNLNRPADELAPLLEIIEEAVASLADQRRWRLHPVGALDLLPAGTAERLKKAVEDTRDVDGMLVNIAVGYGGRREIADAVRVAAARARREGHHAGGARRRSSMSSTSPTTSTPRASPTPTS